MLNAAANVINYVIDMGVSVMLPIVIAIISIAIGIKVGKAVRSGLMLLLKMTKTVNVDVWLSLIHI